MPESTATNAVCYTTSRDAIMGIGRALIKTATEHVASQDTRFLTVKAIAASKSDEYWAAIRASCESVDFLPVEEFPALCSSSDPCLSRIQL